MVTEDELERHWGAFGATVTPIGAITRHVVGCIPTAVGSPVVHCRAQS
jgi:hypothetical protein